MTDEIQPVDAYALEQEVDAYVGEMNAVAIRDYSVDTREVVRTLEEKVVHLEGIVTMLNTTVGAMQQQIGLLHARTLGGGPTSVD